jgi:CheY-like chemotaxis protein
MSPASPTLLLADDSATTRRVVELTFADQGLRVVSVGDGQQAIERAQQDPPDIVLADIGMPGRDGYEVADFLRAHPRLRRVPVLLMAGAFEPADDARVAACGAAGVLVKPLEPDTVISRVKELLGLGGAPAPTPDHRLVTPAEVAPAVQPDPEPEPPSMAPAAPPAEAASNPLAAFAPAPQPAAPAAPVNDAFADAFAALLAAEQGETAGPVEVAAASEPAAPAAGVDVEAVTAEVTTRVTERLISGIGHDVVRSVATEVAARVAREVAEQITRDVVAAVAERVTRDVAAEVTERVVRDEIARLRATTAARR